MGKCIFKKIWLQNSLYSSWIEESSDKYEAKCKFCKESIKLSTMGERSLKYHMNRNKHKRNVPSGSTTMSNFLTSNKLTSSSSNTQSTATASTSGSFSQASSSSTSISATRSSSVSNVASTSTSDNSIPTYIVGKETLNAEVKWCIRTVVKHQSYKSNADIGVDFRDMFPDR